MKVKVQPGQTLCFPGLCAYNLEPAVATMRVRKRRGRVTREIDVPLSASGVAILAAESPAERQRRRAGRLFLALAALMVLAGALAYLPPVLPLLARLLIGGALAAVLTYAGNRWVRVISLRRAADEKLAVINAVTIDTFSWRATTFTFANEHFARRFIALNQPYLMEVDPLT